VGRRARGHRPCRPRRRPHRSPRCCPPPARVERRRVAPPCQASCRSSRNACACQPACDDHPGVALGLSRMAAERPDRRPRLRPVDPPVHGRHLLRSTRRQARRTGCRPRPAWARTRWCPRPTPELPARASVVPMGQACAPWRGHCARFSGRKPMPALAQTACQRCGARTEEPISPRGAGVGPCSCGGVRQVIRIIHHRRGEPPASAEQLERSVRHRSQKETRTRGGRQGRRA
jgi:hypothetical protein